MNTILQTTLATIIQQLADFFGMTTDVIMQNAPMWLAKYGWFCAIDDIGVNIALSILVGAMISVSICATLVFGLDLEKKKSYIVTTVLVMILSCIIGVGMPLVKCAIAPEFYGLQKLIEMLKS